MDRSLMCRLPGLPAGGGGAPWAGGERAAARLWERARARGAGSLVSLRLSLCLNTPSSSSLTCVELATRASRLDVATLRPSSARGVGMRERVGAFCFFQCGAPAVCCSVSKPRFAALSPFARGCVGEG